MNDLFRGRAGIIDPGHNAESCVTRFSGVGGYSAEHAKAESAVVRARKKNFCFGAAAVVDEGAQRTGRRVVIPEIDRTRNENRFVENVLPGRGRVDDDFRRGRHGVAISAFFAGSIERNISEWRGENLWNSKGPPLISTQLAARNA